MGRGIRLTPAGELLLADALELLERSEAFERRAAQVASGDEGSLAIGFGLSGCSFNLIISSFGKLLPESWRSFSFGLGTASGSFGQFLFSPLGVYLIQTFGWRTTLEIFAGLLLLIIPLAVAVATPRQDSPGESAPAK